MSELSGEIRIERLALRVSGLDEGAARELARLVAEGLAPGMLRSAGEAGLDSLQVEVPGDASGQAEPDLLARRIVAGISRELARDRIWGNAAEEAAW